jgi:hypothetical protein
MAESTAEKKRKMEFEEKIKGIVETSMIRWSKSVLHQMISLNQLLVQKYAQQSIIAPFQQWIIQNVPTDSKHPSFEQDLVKFNLTFQAKVMATVNHYLYRYSLFVQKVNPIADEDQLKLLRKFSTLIRNYRRRNKSDDNDGADAAEKDGDNNADCFDSFYQSDDAKGETDGIVDSARNGSSITQPSSKLNSDESLPPLGPDLTQADLEQMYMPMPEEKKSARIHPPSAPPPSPNLSGQPEPLMQITEPSFRGSQGVTPLTERNNDAALLLAKTELSLRGQAQREAPPPSFEAAEKQRPQDKEFQPKDQDAYWVLSAQAKQPENPANNPLRNSRGREREAIDLGNLGLELADELLEERDRAAQAVLEQVPEVDDEDLNDVPDDEKPRKKKRSRFIDDQAGEDDE